MKPGISTSQPPAPIPTQAPQLPKQGPQGSPAAQTCESAPPIPHQLPRIISAFCRPHPAWQPHRAGAQSSLGGEGLPDGMAAWRFGAKTPFWEGRSWEGRCSMFSSRMGDVQVGVTSQAWNPDSPTWPAG